MSQFTFCACRTDLSPHDLAQLVPSIDEAVRLVLCRQLLADAVDDQYQVRTRRVVVVRVDLSGNQSRQKF